MTDRNERAVLNRLIEFCRDGERGFSLAAEQVSDPELRALFWVLAEQRAQFAGELLPHANRLGGDPAHDGSRTAVLHRAWMRLEQKILHDDARITSEVEFGDRITVQAYFDALNGMLPPDTRGIVERQSAALEASHARIPVTAQGA